MEEESYRMHSDEEKVFPEKSNKRRLKTPSQVEALENFYEENKNPPESKKSLIAKKLGLSVKQIQVWFCHRRLKDKKLLKDEGFSTGKQDLCSSIIIPDRGSGLKQDSCGSTKHGENRYFDSKEVESQRFHSHDYRPTVIASDLREQYVLTRNYSVVDDTSSGSTSVLRDRSSLQSGDPYDGYQLGHVMSSRYIYVQDNADNPAIYAVRMKLGRHYREDGPPLGVEFQPLPPNAFDSPIMNPLHEPYYVGDPAMQNSLKIPRGRKQPNVGMDSYLEADCRTMWASHCRNVFSSNASIQRPSFASDHVSGPNSVMDRDGDSSSEASEFDSKGNAARSIHSAELRSNSGADPCLHMYNGKDDTKETSYLPNLPHIHSNDSFRTHAFQRTEYFVASDKKLHSRRMEQVYDRRRAKKYDQNPVQLKMHTMNKRTLGRKLSGEEVRERDYVLKMPSSEELQWRRPIKSYAGEMPINFSEDETSGTCSSMD